jgi:hypothetical protein
MSDTPETDDQPIINAINDNGYQVPCVDIEYARKLERERDEAMEARNECERQFQEKVCEIAQLLSERDEALMDRANGDIATMTRNHYERILRERDEALKKIKKQKLEIVRLNGATNHAGGTPLKISLRERDEARAEIQRLRLDAQREAEQHDRMVKELEGLYDQLAKTKPSNEHICSLSKDLMGNCIICDG